MEAMHPDVESIVLSEEDLAEAVRRLGAEITRDYADKNPLLVAVLRGAVVFMADLMRAIECPVGIDFMAVSSYGNGVKSSGVVRIKKDLDTPIEGRHVLVVEDILDTGYTLDYLVRNFKARGTKSVNTTVLLEKPDRHKVPVDLKYVGFTIPDVWVVGYGLDYAEQYRTLPYIAEMKIPK